MTTDTVVETMKRTFLSAGIRHIVTAQVERIGQSRFAAPSAPYMTVDLTPVDPDTVLKLSIRAEIYQWCGGMWRLTGGGQSTDEFRAAFPGDETVGRICELWERWNLNGTRGGSREQEAIINEWAKAGYPLSKNPGRYNYVSACAVLRARGKYEVPVPGTTRYVLKFQDAVKGEFNSWAEARAAITPHPDGTDHSAEWAVQPECDLYTYGHAWLYEPLPPEVIPELRKLLQDPVQVLSPEAENRARWEKLGIKMSVERADSNPHMPDSRDHIMDHWKCTLQWRRKRLTVVFSQGEAFGGKEPDINSVLKTLIDDAASFESAAGFENWAAEYGYDSDSRKAEALYKAVEHQVHRLERFLGELYNSLVRG